MLGSIASCAIGPPATEVETRTPVVGAHAIVNPARRLADRIRFIWQSYDSATVGRQRAAASYIATNSMTPAMTPAITPDTTAADREIAWQCTPFNDLSPADLYAAMQLRQIVFVVEQNCAYLDADGIDRIAEHLLGWRVIDGRRMLVAYARLLPPRARYAEPSVGRVTTHPDVRGSGVGRELMHKAIEQVEAAGWGSEIRIAAQMYLERFYEGYGFTRVSDPYTEDEIWHVDMLRG